MPLLIITDYIRRGEAYSDDYISTRFGISGVFQDDEDQFVAARHKLMVSVVPKDSVTEAAEDISVRKVEGRHIVADINTVRCTGGTRQPSENSG